MTATAQSLASCGIGREPSDGTRAGTPEVVDEAPDDSRRGVRIVRSLALRSMRLGITGKADVVEFPLHGDGAPFPVEYKRGKRKADLCDEVQLCAQALCLEEMLATPSRRAPCITASRGVEPR